MLELFDKDYKAATIKMIRQTITKSLEKNENLRKEMKAIKNLLDGLRSYFRLFVFKFRNHITLLEEVVKLEEKNLSEHFSRAMLQYVCPAW